MAAKLSTAESVSRLADIYQARRRVCVDGADIEIALDLECFSKARAEAEDAAALAVLPKPIHLATAVATEISRERGTESEYAVYVIHQAGSGHSKIGIGRNPAKRLEVFQIAHWRPIGISALFWIMEGSAEGVEMLSHRLASHLGIKGRGEWVAAAPLRAAEIVAAACLSANVRFADSSMWMRNRQRIRAERSRLLSEWSENKFTRPQPPQVSTKNFMP